MASCAKWAPTDVNPETDPDQYIIELEANIAAEAVSGDAVACITACSTTCQSDPSGTACLNCLNDCVADLGDCTQCINDAGDNTSKIIACATTNGGDTSTNKKSGLSNSAIIGIVIGALAALALILGLSIGLAGRGSKKPEPPKTTAKSSSTGGAPQTPTALR